MKNPNLTKWLEMVWSALAELDQEKRDLQLNTASLFRRDAGLVSQDLVPQDLVSQDLARRDPVSPDLVVPDLVASDEDQERGAGAMHSENGRRDIGRKSRGVSVLELFEPGESWSF